MEPNLGSGPACEWVGWKQPHLTSQLAAPWVGLGERALPSLQVQEPSTGEQVPPLLQLQTEEQLGP